MKHLRILALLLTLCACAQRPVLLGSPPGKAGAAVAAPNVQSWWLHEQSALPKPAGDQLNRQLGSLIRSRLPNPCAEDLVAMDRSQRALFDHVAGLLQQSPDMSLDGLGLGPVRRMQSDCRQLWTMTGRFGGGQPGWLALGVVDLPSGTISSFTAGRWAAVDSMSTDQIAALAGELVNRLGATGP